LLEISHRALLYKIKEYGIIENVWRKLDFWNHGEMKSWSMDSILPDFIMKTLLFL